MEHKDVFTLDTILDYCDRIVSTVQKYHITLESLEADQNYQDMLAFCIIQIGECVTSLSSKFIDSHPEIEWRKIIGFRNIIVHDYGSVAPEILWDTVIDKIPTLREFCQKQIKP